MPWIALVLGITFACYGLLRKVAALGPLEGLTLETLVLAPLAIAALLFWARAGTGAFPSNALGTNVWLIALGPITAAAISALGVRVDQVAADTDDDAMLAAVITALQPP